MQYFVEKQILKEIIFDSKGQQLDCTDTLLSKLLLRNNRHILTAVSEQINYVRNDVKDTIVFPCLIESVEQSRNNASQASERLASNAITLLNYCD